MDITSRMPTMDVICRRQNKEAKHPSSPRPSSRSLRVPSSGGRTGKRAGWGALKQLEEKPRGPNLSELHHHVGKHVQESHHGVPEAAVRQALLVPGAGALQAEGCVWARRGAGAGLPALPQPAGPTWMYSVRLLNTCLATDMALEKFLLPCSSMTSLPE